MLKRGGMSETKNIIAVGGVRQNGEGERERGREGGVRDKRG